MLKIEWYLSTNSAKASRSRDFSTPIFEVFMFLRKVFQNWESSLIELHEGFRAKGPYIRTLRDAFVLCNLSDERLKGTSEAEIASIWRHMTTPGNNLLMNQFGIYNLPQCSVMERRAHAVRDVIADFGDSVFLQEDVTVEELSRISTILITHSNTAVFPIKAFILARKDDAYKMAYDGFHPNTSPCRRVSYRLFGEDFAKDPLKHRDLCQSMGEELGISSTDANSLLYLIGEDWK